MSGPEPALSPTSTRIADRLAGWPRRTIALSELRELFVAADPEAGHGTAARKHLRETIEELTSAGIATAQSSGWDRTERPHLPGRLRLSPSSPASVTARVAAREVSWRPEMTWAPAAITTARQLADLVTINSWLRDNRGPVRAPLRERSLDIFGEEKHLDALLTTGLLGPGRLTLDLLATYRAAPPLPQRELGDGPVLLVVENSDTFDSLCRALAPAPGRIGAVAWGAGAGFEQSVQALLALPAITTVRYFGDVDLIGLRIPQNASKLAAQLGLPAVSPAVGLYQAALATGVWNPTRGATADHAARVADWLPSHLRSRVSSLLRSGRRVPQEAVGIEVLAASDEWRGGLTDRPDVF